MPIAQFNIAEALDTMDSPVMTDFVNNTDRINTLAEQSPGFIWRLIADDKNDSYSIQAFDSEFILINMSVWETRDALFQFVYNSGHMEIFRRKKEWFQRMPKMHMVLWNIDTGHIPTIQEGKERLKYLQQYGESEFAFTFKSSF